jgi:hypothetical protein
MLVCGRESAQAGPWRPGKDKTAKMDRIKISLKLLRIDLRH